MKAVSSVLLVVGLTSLQAMVFAADAPVAGAKKVPAASAATKGAAPAGTAAKGAAPANQAGPASATAKNAPAPVPAAPTVVLEPDGVAFGIGAEDVARLYDRWWDKQFVSRYQKANPGPKTRELDFELAEKKKVLRRIAIFDGRMTSFDKADFREEFAHGSDETMTSSKLSRRPAGEEKALLGDKPGKDAKSVAYTRRFFFHRDRLWKVYDEYRLDDASPFGADFKEATARVEATLGKGVKRTRAPESQFESVAFETGTMRVRVVKLPSDKLAIVRSDNALTKEVLDRRAQQAKMPDSEALDDEIQAVIR